MLKIFLIVAVVVVAALAAPESHEVPDDSYKVDDDRFDDANKVYSTKVSKQQPDVFRSHHQYVQEDGTIVGEYAVLAPDGITLQIVKYTSGIGGYNAKVVHTDDLTVF